jgi:DNA-binding response OmpR family regulator
VLRPLAIIEPDPIYSASIRRTFADAGFHADCFPDERSAFESLRSRAFALAIVELDRDAFDPFAVTAEVSRIVPVLTITTDPGEEQCIRALQSGADDCVCRPVPDRELIARVRNILRRHDLNEAGDPTLSSDLTISIAEMRVRVGGIIHDLTRGEAEVLSLLLEYAPVPLTASRIAELLPAARGTVESRIRSLRRKLGPDHLMTRGRLGYELR